jgi:hypothetical protein
VTLSTVEIGAVGGSIEPSAFMLMVAYSALAGWILDAKTNILVRRRNNTTIEKTPFNNLHVSPFISSWQSNMTCGKIFHVTARILRERYDIDYCKFVKRLRGFRIPRNVSVFGGKVLSNQPELPRAETL